MNTSNDGKTPVLETPPKAWQLPPNIKQFTPEEKRLGLCFNCDERYHRGRTCKKPAPLLLLQEQPQLDSSCEDDDDGSTDTSTPPLAIEASPIALHVLVRESSPKSLKLRSQIGSHELQVLVDLGILNVAIDQSKNFDVYIGNNDCMRCSGVCQQVGFRINSITFFVNLFITPFMD